MWRWYKPFAVLSQKLLLFHGSHSDHLRLTTYLNYVPDSKIESALILSKFSSYKKKTYFKKQKSQIVTQIKLILKVTLTDYGKFRPK